MLRSLVFILFFLISLNSQANEILVSVVDKGIENLSPNFEKYILRDKSFDFVSQSKSRGVDYPLRSDNEAHGSFIAFQIVSPYSESKVKVLDMVYDSDEQRAFAFLFADSSLALYRRKVFYKEETQKVIEAFNLSVRHGAKVINFSSGSPFFDSEALEIWLKDNSEILLVVSAGNEGRDLDQYPHYPCSIKQDNLFCVGSVDKKNRKSEFSNYGKGIIKAKGEYREFKGTSFAAPEVSRALALLMKQRSMTTSEYRKQIISKFGVFK